MIYDHNMSYFSRAKNKSFIIAIKNSEGEKDQEIKADSQR